jgi:hypothetical protein
VEHSATYGTLNLTPLMGFLVVGVQDDLDGTSDYNFGTQHFNGPFKIGTKV